MNGLESGRPPLEIYFSFECLWPQPIFGPASPPSHHENHLIWVDSSPIAPLSCFWPLLTWLSLPVWLSREPSELNGLNSDSPPWLAWKVPLEFPLESFLGQSLHVDIYCTLLKFCTITDSSWERKNFFRKSTVNTLKCLEKWFVIS